ncbi:hypothetical protein BGZ54_007124 [Gamsiella multidivaricata]|nr:hypothetical protein BGZ54_007124 [Gamsiella multidivaricata]
MRIEDNSDFELRSRTQNPNPRGTWSRGDELMMLRYERAMIAVRARVNRIRKLVSGIVIPAEARKRIGIVTQRADLNFKETIPPTDGSWADLLEELDNCMGEYFPGNEMEAS